MVERVLELGETKTYDKEVQRITENNATPTHWHAAEAQRYLEMTQSIHNSTVAAFGAKSNKAAQSAADLACATREAIKAKVRLVLCEFPDVPTVTIRYVDAVGVKSEFTVDRDIW